MCTSVCLSLTLARLASSAHLDLYLDTKSAARRPQPHHGAGLTKKANTHIHTDARVRIHGDIGKDKVVCYIAILPRFAKSYGRGDFPSLSVLMKLCYLRREDAAVRLQEN